MEEVQHHIQVLKEVRKELIEKDAVRLKELSNQTIHSATLFHAPGSTLIAVIVYTLSKIIERQDYRKIKNWGLCERRLVSFINLGIKALEDEKEDAFNGYMQQARTALTSASINLKPYIEELFRKASINKAGKLYEHGLSLGQTAKLLGITQWELSGYAGQGNSENELYNATLNTKKRAKMALEFFS